MFGSNKLEQFKKEQRLAAIKYIEEALEEQTTQAELMYSYGVIDLAFEANIISINERAAFKTKASEKENQRRRSSK